ncbi:MAG: VirB3 family type IV secretion system protein [Acetobacteraceae bacterium]|nr:VirB3 family type IV secretion system protein [Acetobacteraceae bacterium]
MPLPHETLFLACTRPAMRHGVPMEAWYLNLFGTFLFGMIMGSPLYWVAGGPIYVLTRILAGWDPNFFGILRRWAETKGQAFGTVLYGGSALLALSPGTDGRRRLEYPTCV